MHSKSHSFLEALLEQVLASFESDSGLAKVSAFDMRPWPRKSDAWSTAFVLRKLHRLDAVGFLRSIEAQKARQVRELMKSTACWLASMERSEGGWGYNSETRADLDSTCNAIVALAPSGFVVSEATLSFIGKHLQGNCRTHTFLPRWPDDTWARSSWEVAGTFLQAAKASDNLHKHFSSEVNQVEAWLSTKSSFESFWWTTSSYGLKEMLQAGVRPISEAANAALDAVQHGSRDTNFGSLNRMACFLYLGRVEKVRSLANQFVNSHQFADDFHDEKILVAPPIGSNVPAEFEKFDVSFELVDYGSIFTRAVALELFGELWQLSAI